MSCVPHDILREEGRRRRGREGWGEEEKEGERRGKGRGRGRERDERLIRKDDHQVII